MRSVENLREDAAQFSLGLQLRQINNFLGSTPFSVTITPTISILGIQYLVVAGIKWLVDTSFSTGGSVSVQMHYQVNGIDRITWSAIFSEFINDEMPDEGYCLMINGSNSLTFFTSLGATTIANGYFMFKGIYQ